MWQNVNHIAPAVVALEENGRVGNSCVGNEDAGRVDTANRGQRRQEKGEGEIDDATSRLACLGSMGPVGEFDNLEALRAESIDQRSVGCATT